VVTAERIRSSRFFEPQKLSGLEKMRFTTPRRVEGAYSGRHIAKRQGGAGEFVDYREYTPGDDLRRVDWRVMGRMGRAYLKLYQDETDLSCTLVLDVSGSMLQGHLDGTRSHANSPASKLEWMQYFATALSHLIVLARDSVGLALVNDGLVKYVPPSSTYEHRLLLHEQIERLQPTGASQLARGLDELLVRVRRRGVLLVISDFLVDSADTLMGSLRKFRSRGWEVIALHLVHPDEERLPEGMAFRFIGLEGEGLVNCTLAEVRRAYQDRFAAHLAATRAALIGTGCDYHRASTASSYLDVLRAFLVLRSA
jgi:uncharacterized protein (DUF58 family)